MEEPEIVSRERIFNSFFALDEIKIRYPSSSEDLTRHIIVPKQAVAILLYRKDTDKIVFSKQYRLAAEQWLLEIPAGVMDAKNEKPEATACRESEEETGYKIESPQFITTYYPSPGNSSEKIHLYYAEVDANAKTGDGGGLDDENENIKVLEIGFVKAMEMIDSSEINDGKTIIALLWLYRKKKAEASKN
jgi:ADP-ribose pyrophosphatase